jgi:hypothetical protein
MGDGSWSQMVATNRYKLGFMGKGWRLAAAMFTLEDI